MKNLKNPDHLEFAKYVSIKTTFIILCYFEIDTSKYQYYTHQLARLEK